MSKFFRFVYILLPGLIVLAACSPAGAVKSVTAGDVLVENAFSKAGTFEEGIYDGVALRIADGVYRMTLDRGDNELWWGQWGDTLADVVIEVDITQTSARNESAYGVGCRMRGTTGQAVTVDPALTSVESIAEATEEATQEVEPSRDATAEATSEATAEVTQEATTEATAESTAESEDEISASVLSDEFADGDGYLFLIQGTGSYAIMRSTGRDVQPLVNWTSSDKVNQGPGRNQIRAICMGDYLALYVNGEFLADVTDTTYTSGQVGLLASAATRLGVVVEFDNLKVSAAQPD